MSVLGGDPHGSYRRRVVDQLRAQGATTALSDHEEALACLGLEMGVGPGDCACQIIADRETPP